MKKTLSFLLLACSAAVTALSADDSTARLDRAATAFDAIAKGIKSGQIPSADCIGIVPAFKKGAAGVGIGFGKGFISCRTQNGDWSAPGAITLETASLGVQLGGEEMDIVIVSLNKDKRAKLLSDRFTIGTDAAAAWGNGKITHEDPDVKIVFYGRTKGAFAGFGLDGATLKPDESGNRALYGKSISNGEIIAEMRTPAPAESLIGKLNQAGK